MTTRGRAGYNRRQNNQANQSAPKAPGPLKTYAGAAVNKAKNAAGSALNAYVKATNKAASAISSKLPEKMTQSRPSSRGPRRQSGK